MGGIIGSIGSKSGVITSDNYAFRAHLSAAQSITSATLAKVDFDTVQFGANYWSASNQRLDVPQTGKWQINYGIKTTTSVYAVVFYFRVDGGGILHQGWIKHLGLNGITCGDVMTDTMSDVIYLTAGTYIELWCVPHVNFTLEYSTTSAGLIGGGADQQADQATWISGHFIGK